MNLNLLRLKKIFLNSENKEMIEDLIVITINEIIQMIETARGDINEKNYWKKNWIGNVDGKIKSIRKS